MKVSMAILSGLMFFLSSNLAGACEKSIVAKHHKNLKKAALAGHRSHPHGGRWSGKKTAHHKLHKRAHSVQHNHVTELPAKYARSEKMQDFNSSEDLASIHRQPTNEMDSYPAPEILSTIRPASGPSQDFEVNF